MSLVDSLEESLQSEIQGRGWDIGLGVENSPLPETGTRSVIAVHTGRGTRAVRTVLFDSVKDRGVLDIHALVQLRLEVSIPVLDAEWLRLPQPRPPFTDYVVMRRVMAR